MLDKLWFWKLGWKYFELFQRRLQNNFAPYVFTIDLELENKQSNVVFFPYVDIAQEVIFG